MIECSAMGDWVVAKIQIYQCVSHRRSALSDLFGWLEILFHSKTIECIKISICRYF